ncbi:MAG: LysE family transporter [Taibaiella sp.]|nr:LysE family transporter [Taibaiella sp.]
MSAFFCYLAFEMLVLDAILKGFLVGLFMAISVGPTLFAIIKYSLNFSYKAGLAFVLGVSVSDILYVLIANMAASWLRYLEPYERHIAFGGAVALMAIGLFGLLKKLKPKRPSSVQLVISNGDLFKIWLSGFLVNTLNPGVLITWLGAVTITANTTGFYRFLLFGVALAVILSIDFSKVFLADRIKRMLTVRKVIYVQRFSAACILLIGLALFAGTIFNIQSKEHKGDSEINRILSR